jgi:hypothetical protein
VIDVRPSEDEFDAMAKVLGFQGTQPPPPDDSPGKKAKMAENTEGVIANVAAAPSVLDSAILLIEGMAVFAADASTVAGIGQTATEIIVAYVRSKIVACKLALVANTPAADVFHPPVGHDPELEVTTPTPAQIVTTE